MLGLFGHSLRAVATEHGEKLELGIFGFFEFFLSSRMAQVALFSVAVVLSCRSECPDIMVSNLLSVFGSGFGHVAPNDRANSKKHQISSRGPPRPSQGNVSAVAPVSGRSRSYAHCGCCKHGEPRCYGRGTRHRNIDSKKKPATGFFCLFPAFSWAAVSTAYFSEDSKTDEPIKISTIFRFSLRTWTHFWSKPRNKPSLGHICVVSFSVQNILMTLFPLVWSADTTPVHAHNCTTRTIQSAWFGKKQLLQKPAGFAKARNCSQRKNRVCEVLVLY